MNFYFRRDNGVIDKEIDRLIELAGGIKHPDIVREMIIAALKAGQEEEEKADLKLMNTTLKEMRFTAKIFGPYRNKKKVTVFGSARTKPDEPIYQMAKDFGRRLADRGFMVITGGGAGIMQAVNEGAGPEMSFGVNIRLPFEQKPNPVLADNPRLITYKYFFNRKVAFLKEADAVALFPGGFGTLDEAMETITLVQTGKRNPLPLVLIDEPEGKYWARWIKFFEDELLAQDYIAESDFNIFERVNSVDDAIMKIMKFYRRYHSLRYVDGKTVLRLTSKLDGNVIKEINDAFSEILIPGGRIYASDAFPQEADEPDIADLPRLVVEFNMKDFGKLRRLIDIVNNY